MDNHQASWHNMFSYCCVAAHARAVHSRCGVPQDTSQRYGAARLATHLHGAVALNEKLSSRLLGSSADGVNCSVFFLQQQHHAQGRQQHRASSNSTGKDPFWRCLCALNPCRPARACSCAGATSVRLCARTELCAVPSCAELARGCCIGRQDQHCNYQHDAYIKLTWFLMVCVFLTACVAI